MTIVVLTCFNSRSSYPVIGNEMSVIENEMSVKTLIKQIWVMFTRLQLWVAGVRHNLTWVKI